MALNSYRVFDTFDPWKFIGYVQAASDVEAIYLAK